MRPSRLALAGTVLSLLVACGRKTSHDEAPAPFGAWSSEGTGAALPSAVEGSLRVGRRAIDFGVYLPEVPTLPEVSAAQQAARDLFPGVAVLASPDSTPPPTALVFSPSVTNLPPPTLDQIRYDGRGVRAGQAEAIAASKGLVAVVLRFDDDPDLSRLHGAQQLAVAIARAGHGAIWDEATREVYTTDEWQKVRLEGWEGARVEARRQIAIHYDDSPGGRRRLVTLGMVKLGFPDLVLADVLPNEIGGASRVLDGVAQLLVEGASVGAGGTLDFDLSAVKHEGARRALLSAPGAATRLRGPLTLAPLAPEAGDPDNRIVEIHFPLYDQAVATARALPPPSPADAGSAPARSDAGSK